MTPAALAALAQGDNANYMAAMLPGGIEAHEAAGQQMLCKSELLPIDLQRVPRKVFEDLGFTFGEPVDSVFVKGTLPPGWQIKPTEHSMWNDLVDEKGRKRGGMFYKAAFYDRSAFMRLTGRYSYSAYEEGSSKDVHAVAALDCGKVLHTFGEYKRTGDYDLADSLREMAKAWLNEHYPEWQNESSYWD